MTGHPKQQANNLQVKRENHRAHMRTKAGYVLVKAFFLTNSQSIMADIIKKSSDVSISHNFKLSFFILQQCHKCSVMA